MSEDLYTDEILRLAAEIPRLGTLSQPDVTIRHVSPVCGSRIVIDVAFDADGRVADYAQQVNACALGQASSAIVGQVIQGLTPAQIREGTAIMRGLLSSDAPKPTGLWAGLEILRPARVIRSRHGSVMLPFDALEKALKQKGL